MLREISILYPYIKNTTLYLISQLYIYVYVSYRQIVCYTSFSFLTVADPEILKRVALYFGHHGQPMKEILGFRWSKKGKITLKTITFCANYFSEYFQIFSIFVYNESFPMKSYQFFKICKCLGQRKKRERDKDREKKLKQPSMRKEKLRKVGLCLITGIFIKSFNMIIIQFFVSQAHLLPKFCFLISG